jgi:GNAT superfamily N-acetyltransferase
MTDDNFVISEASRSEGHTILSMLADAEGWRVCFESIDSWLASDPQMFFIGRLNGEHIAHVSAIRYEENYGFIGCFWVRKDHRGKGFGVRMFRHALQHLEGCNIGISAVLNQVQNYQKSGFIPFSSDTRFIGKAATVSVPTSHSSHIIPYNETLLEAIAVYDRQVFPSVRKAFLREYFQMSNSFTRVYVENGNIRGYSVLHRVYQSYEIGPCFADNQKIAKALIASLVNCLPENTTFGVNIQEENPEISQFVTELSEYRLEVWMQLKRMYTVEPPKIDVTKLWIPTGFTTG